MLVTLDVSKLSGWLNLYAACRVTRTAHEAGRGVWAGRREGGGRGGGANRMKGRARLEVRDEGTH
eukprot:scaffold26680_cov52-Phaeocystis_antarctica.AAC.2